jgi:DNA invertase Pin-like site-specific DNA recombinase
MPEMTLRPHRWPWAIGYARVSTVDQNEALQRRELEGAGCNRIYTDKASGKNADRPELTKALDRLEEGDTLVVWKLDRLGRSLLDLITIVKNLEDRGVNFRSLTEGFDTTTNGGRLVFQIMGALAEYERNLIRERTRAGLAAAKAAGHRGGPKFKLPDRDLDWLLDNWETMPVDDIARELKIGRATAYRAYHRAKARQA